MVDPKVTKNTKLFNEQNHQDDMMAKVIKRQLKLPPENFTKNLGMKVNPFRNLDITDEESYISLNISGADTDK